jgi:hypothetical protein
MLGVMKDPRVTNVAKSWEPHMWSVLVSHRQTLQIAETTLTAPRSWVADDIVPTPGLPLL